MQIGFIEDTKLHGGTQLWVFEAITYFLQEGNKITIITPKEGWLSEECKKNEVPVILITYNYDEIVSNNTEYEDIWVNALRTCDVVICTVHPPRGNFHCSIFAAKCIKKAKLKTILVTKAGTVVPTYRREFYFPDESIPSFIITIADFTRNYLIKRYNIPEEKCTRIYQGVDVDRFTPNSTRRRKSLNEYPLISFSPILGCVGSLERRKGHLILLKVLRILKRFLPRVHLLIVGDGPDEQILKDIVAKMSLNNHVTFISYTREPELIYERIDILIFPSLYKEGLPNVLLESLAMKTPVIASNIGGVSEVVRNEFNGYLVEPDQTNQLVNAIDKIWSNQNRYRWISNNARGVILRNFDRKVQFQKFIKFLKVITNK